MNIPQLQPNTLYPVVANPFTRALTGAVIGTGYQFFKNTFGKSNHNWRDYPKSAGMAALGSLAPEGYGLASKSYKWMSTTQSPYGQVLYSTLSHPFTHQKVIGAIGDRITNHYWEKNRPQWAIPSRNNHMPLHISSLHQPLGNNYSFRSFPYQQRSYRPKFYYRRRNMPYTALNLPMSIYRSYRRHRNYMRSRAELNQRRRDHMVHQFTEPQYISKGKDGKISLVSTSTHATEHATEKQFKRDPGINTRHAPGEVKWDDIQHPHLKN
ncbi:hypothetical protein P9112_009939 [Eukaryota sp. TZLM1-RC]